MYFFIVIISCSINKQTYIIIATYKHIDGKSNILKKVKFDNSNILMSIFWCGLVSVGAFLFITVVKPPIKLNTNKHA